MTLVLPVHKELMEILEFKVLKASRVSKEYKVVLDQLVLKEHKVFRVL